MAQDGLNKAHNVFEFYRDGQKYLLKDVMSLETMPLTYVLNSKVKALLLPEWSVPYKGTTT